MTRFTEVLTDAALAERLRRAAYDPRRWPPTERKALMLESAKRLMGCRHRRYSGEHCAEMSCANYIGKHTIGFDEFDELDPSEVEP